MSELPGRAEAVSWERRLLNQLLQVVFELSTVPWGSKVVPKQKCIPRLGTELSARVCADHACDLVWVCSAPRTVLEFDFSRIQKTRTIWSALSISGLLMVKWFYKFCKR